MTSPNTDIVNIDRWYFDLSQLYCLFLGVYTNGFPDPLDSTVVEEQTHSLRCLDDSKVVIEPADLLDLNILKFMWFYKSGSNVEPVVESSRIKINPKNGELNLHMYFIFPKIA